VLAARTDPGWEPAAEAARVLSRNDVDYLVIAARGTSDNAARGVDLDRPHGLRKVTITR
jgi:hypothetical protein